MINISLGTLKEQECMPLQSISKQCFTIKLKTFSFCQPTLLSVKDFSCVDNLGTPAWVLAQQPTVREILAEEMRTGRVQT